MSTMMRNHRQVLEEIKLQNERCLNYFLSALRKDLREAWEDEDEATKEFFLRIVCSGQETHEVVKYFAYYYAGQRNAREQML